jgi:hypothetical protein
MFTGFYNSRNFTNLDIPTVFGYYVILRNFLFIQPHNKSIIELDGEIQTALSR